MLHQKKILKHYQDQSETDMDKTFNLIHDLNFPRKHHPKIAAQRMWKRAIRKICDENKVNLLAPLGKWTLEIINT